MQYYVTKFIIKCNIEELMEPCRELLADDCGECGYESFEDTDEGLNAYIQQTEYDEAAVQQLVEAFPVEGVTLSYSTESIPDQDWNAAWEEIGFEPIIVKDKVTIYDARNTKDLSTFYTPIEIGIHASNAFGTGTHETTRMIVGTLIDMPLDGKRLLDCGCGTGILAITALKCGAAEAVGYDIDEWSSENAKHNAMLNGVTDRMTSLLGDATVLDSVSGTFDVVVANINRNILLADMKRFRSKMADGASLILSGFYETDIPMLLQEAEALGLKESLRNTDNDWAMLLLHNA